MRLLAALSCLFTGVCIAAPHTPEQEYTLQARVVLQRDPIARDQLALWDAAAVPRNGIDWQRSLDDLPTWLRQQQIVPPSASVMQDVTDALLARLSTATCQAEAFLPLGSPEIGRFTLACALPDPAPTFALYRALRQAGPGGQAQHSDVFFSAYAVHLRSAPAALHRTHVVGWSSYRHGDVHEARSDQLYQVILLTLLPFEAWDMRIAGDVPPILLHD
ncbi:hypothetical protein Q2B95_16605 [Stenotrophomonas maltophilia]|uniref:hypothetical protein n=1 Tax=Stenotrophomonas maltophilia TaxID=40324 RepID=UPI0030B5846C